MTYYTAIFKRTLNTLNVMFGTQKVSESNTSSKLTKTYLCLKIKSCDHNHHTMLSIIIALLQLIYS